MHEKDKKLDHLQDTPDTTIHRQAEPGLHVVTLTRPTHTELFVTATPREGESHDALFERAAGVLRDRQAAVVSQEVFGATADPEACLAPLGDRSWPVTWIHERPEAPQTLAGTQVWAVAGIPVEPLACHGQTVGAVFGEGATRMCRLGALAPQDPAGSRREQARAIFDQMETALASADMDFHDVLRTWFFNDDILAWYGDFNDVRRAFFKERRIFNGLVPASTGIGGGNETGAALSAALLAVRGGDEHVHAAAVASPLQGPAIEYGSDFSRAVELAMPGHRCLFISGTASICPEGETLHLDDVDAQIARTMDVAHAILDSRAMGWDDLTRAIIYFKHAADRPRFAAYCAEHSLPPLPVVTVTNDVCRDNLLFEIELDAARVGAAPEQGA